MHGDNRLVLNESAMVEAIQLWINQRMKYPAPTVTSIKTINPGSIPRYEITLSDEVTNTTGEDNAK